GKALRKGNDIRSAAPMVAAEELSGAANAGHHLVMDEQDSKLVAYLADPHEIAVWRNQRCSGGAANGLHYEGEHAFRPFCQDFLLKHVGVAQSAFFQRKVVSITVDEGRRNQRHGVTHLPEGRGEHIVASDTERADGNAVI